MRAADEEEALRGADDDALLALATEEGRLMVTFDAKDFPRLHREWAHAGRPHAGCLVLTGIDHSRFGDIVRAISGAIEARPMPEQWREVLLFVSGGR